MGDKNFLLKQSLSSTIKKLKSEGAPINSMSDNHSKVLENPKLWEARFGEVFELLNRIKISIHEGKDIQPITIIRTENFPEIMMDYIIMFMLIEVASFFANNGHLTLEIVDYITGMGPYPEYTHEKLLIADLRNLHIRKEHEQETFILKLLQQTSKRASSKLYNIIIIDETLKELIQGNSSISTNIKNTILLK